MSGGKDPYGDFDSKLVGGNRAGSAELSPITRSIGGVPAVNYAGVVHSPTSSDVGPAGVLQADHVTTNFSSWARWSPMTSTGAALGVVVLNPHPPPPQSTCRMCQLTQTDPNDPLFQPCRCGLVHRSCFKKSRRGFITPSNFYSCETCMREYKMEQLRSLSFDTEEEIRGRIRFAIAKVWLAMIFIIAAVCSIISTIAWASDPNKNVPVATKAMLTSVVFGFPDANETKVWRESFKDPNVHVVQYYGLLGSFITAILILIASALHSCLKEDEVKHRSSRGMCDECCSGSGSSNSYWFCYWGSPNCDCSCCDCGGSGGGGCDCGSCDAPKCDGAGEAAAIIAVIVIVVVLVSAIFVAVGFGIKKTAELQNYLATAIRTQEYERENGVVIFGQDEVVRPSDQV